MDAYNLLDESYTTVSVSFYNSDEEAFREKGKTYNYKVPKEWDIKADDFLVVPATETLRIVKVREVHAEPQFNGLPRLRYAVQRVDMIAHEELEGRERKFRDALQLIERNKKKAELLATLRTSAAGSPEAALLLGDALEMIGIAPPFAPFAAAPF